MQELFEQGMDYIRMVWRYRWLAFFCALCISVLGWAYVAWLPNQYEVSAKVYFDTRSSLKPLLRGLAVENSVAEDSAKLMLRTLVTRSNLEAVARAADLDIYVQTDQELDNVVENLRKGIEFSNAGEHIYDIKYSDTDPKTAHRVVESLLNMFIENVLVVSRSDSEETKAFLDKQIGEYDAKLVAAEQRLEEFKQKNRGLMPADGRNYFARLEQTREALQQIKLELQEATRRRDVLHQQAVSARVSGSGGLGAVPSALDVRIQNFETRLDELLLQYTDKHPTVVSTRHKLEELKAKKASDQSSGSQGADGIDPSVGQDLSIALATAQGEVAALGARVVEYNRRLDDLDKLVDTVPKVEAELASLNRDYNIHRNRYEALVERRETASITEKAERADEMQFKIVEPPRVPLVATGPDRLLLTTAVLVVAIGAGIALTLMLALIRPTFHSRKMLKEHIDIPVLGCISVVRTAAETRRANLAATGYAVACCCLLTLYVGLMLVHTQGINLIAELGSLKGAIL